MIKKVGSQFKLFSKDGSRLLGHGSKEEMKKREKQVNYFKNLKSIMRNK